jgi:heme exporter protein B
VASLFPLGIGPEPQLLQRMGPGVVWVAALLAAMLGMPRLFADDASRRHAGAAAAVGHAAGPAGAGQGGGALAAPGLLLVAVSPVLALQYGLPADQIGMLMLSLLLGTPVLSLIGAIGSALTVGVRGAAVLLALLVLPLVTPVLIFGAGAVEAAGSGLGAGGHLSLLGAMLARRCSARRWPRPRPFASASTDIEAVLRHNPAVAHGSHQLVPFRSAAALLWPGRPLLPWCARPRCCPGAYGLWMGLVVAPTDFQQGDSYRIIFMHVPASWMSMVLYLAMAFWAAVGLIFNSRLSSMLARRWPPPAR